METQITKEFVSLMSYLTMINEFKREGYTLAEHPVSQGNLDVLDKIIDIIDSDIDHQTQFNTFISNITAYIHQLLPIVLNQYQNITSEIEKQNSDNQVEQSIG